jgi:hypothetical protein
VLALPLLPIAYASALLAVVLGLLCGVGALANSSPPPAEDDPVPTVRLLCLLSGVAMVVALSLALVVLLPV